MQQIFAFFNLLICKIVIKIWDYYIIWDKTLANLDYHIKFSFKNTLNNNFKVNFKIKLL